MGLFSFLFPRETDVRRGTKTVICPVCMQEHPVSYVSWSGICNNCSAILRVPLETREERDPSIRKKFDWENMWSVSPTGITYPHDKCDPQQIIPHLYVTQQVFFHWDKNNAVDPTALKIFTADEKYIGWYPKTGYRKAEVLQMIEQRKPFGVFIIKTYQHQDGVWGYDIVIAPPRPNITPETLPIPAFRYEHAKPYYDAFMQALYLSGVIHLDWITFTESNDSITFQIGKTAFCMVKYAGRLTYCTSLRPVEQCAKELPNYIVEQSPKSFGIFQSRISIQSPDDMTKLKDSIFRDFQAVIDELRAHGKGIRPN